MNLLAHQARATGPPSGRAPGPHTKAVWNLAEHGQSSASLGLTRWMLCLSLILCSWGSSPSSPRALLAQLQPLGPQPPLCPSASTKSGLQAPFGPAIASAPIFRGPPLCLSPPSSGASVSGPLCLRVPSAQASWLFCFLLCCPFAVSRQPCPLSGPSFSSPVVSVSGGYDPTSSPTWIPPCSHLGTLLGGPSLGGRVVGWLQTACEGEVGRDQRVCHAQEADLATPPGKL